MAVKARFFRDEEGRYVLELAVEAQVAVTCQRCLGELEECLQSQTQLVALWSDAEAGQLPARYDPLVVGEELDLWQAVEDELLLALPTIVITVISNAARKQAWWLSRMMTTELMAMTAGSNKARLTC